MSSDGRGVKVKCFASTTYFKIPIRLFCSTSVLGGLNAESLSCFVLVLCTIDRSSSKVYQHRIRFRTTWGLRHSSVEEIHVFLFCVQNRLCRHPNRQNFVQLRVGGST